LAKLQKLETLVVSKNKMKTNVCPLRSAVCDFKGTGAIRAF
jgi:hypothetical protein